jgi:7-cyano-7-deazaguanine synthase in queuosine biosynthesis
MHQIAVHLHPFAEELEFRDITKDSSLFISKADNYKDKIGLKNVSYYSSAEGIMLYPDHQYELVLKTNNTTDVNQDMMASMFVFLYDIEMAEKLKAYNSNQ